MDAGVAKLAIRDGLRSHWARVRGGSNPSARIVPAWRRHSPRGIDALRIAFGIIGAVFLAYLGARTLSSAFRIRLGGEVEVEVATPRRAFATSLAATASNPMTIASWAAVFAAASTADLVSSGFKASAPVGGVTLGTFTWFLVLSVGLSLARRRAGARLLVVVDLVSGLALLGFAGLLAWRTIADS